MDRARVVAVDGAGGPGSGYVIGPRLVLTSAHVVPAAGGAVSLFRPGREPSWRGTVIWRGTPGRRDDAALVRIDDPDWAAPPGAPVRWGRLATHRPGTACEAWGVPELVQRPGRAVDTLQPTGTLNPGDRHVGNRYVMNLGQHPPSGTADGASPWGGMSGAALFCGDLLTGVIAADPAGRAHAHLEAVPAYVLMHDATFRIALVEHSRGMSTVLEPVEWQHLAEAADPAASGPASPPGSPVGPSVGSPAALLRARRQVVPFRGRTQVMGDLRAWCGEAGFGARLLYGPGGQGKTRLAQHLADTQSAEGWSTLWLSGDADGDAMAVLAAAAVPLLIVVDYAETRTAQLAALLRATARHGGGTPLKLLLLARAAGDWWQALQAASPVAEELLDGIRATALPALEPEAGPSRAEAYHQAVHGYAAHLPRVSGWQHHDWPALAARLAPPEADQAAAGSRLDRPGLQTALTLHMTALADLLDTADRASRASGPQGVEDRLLAHERRYWTTTATARALHPALTLDTLTDALAAAFLLGAETRAQGEELLHRVPGLADQTKDRLGAVRGWIAALYPTTGSRPWDTLQPDRLAERFIGRHLEVHPDLPDHLVPEATEEQAAQLLTISTRAAAHPVFDRRLAAYVTALCVRHAAILAGPAIDVATRTEAPEPLLEALHQVTDAPGTLLADLERLSGRLPDTSHNLAPWAAHLTRLLVDQYRVRAQDDPDHRSDLARSLNNLFVQLSALARSEEALDAITEAVNVYRELNLLRPDYRSRLATTLNNLSNGLGSLRLNKEALDAITEAVKIRRELFHLRPDAYRPDLCSSLNNLAVRLGNLRRHREALDAITEAVVLGRKLAELQRDAYRPTLALTLNNLANQLASLGRREKALTAITEASDIYRELAHQRPDAYQPDLAMSLDTLSSRLAALGRREEALTAATEAVKIRHELVHLRPNAYQRNLAMSLSNLSLRLGALGRREEGLAAVTEALKIWRELVQLRPDVHQSELEQSLRVLSRLQSG